MFTASPERHRHVDSAAVCGQRAILVGCSQLFASRLRAAKELLCLSKRCLGCQTRQDIHYSFSRTNLENLSCTIVGNVALTTTVPSDPLAEPARRRRCVRETADLQTPLFFDGGYSHTDTQAKLITRLVRGSALRPILHALTFTRRP